MAREHDAKLVNYAEEVQRADNPIFAQVRKNIEEGMNQNPQDATEAIVKGIETLRSLYIDQPQMFVLAVFNRFALTLNASREFISPGDRQTLNFLQASREKVEMPITRILNVGEKPRNYGTIFDVKGITDTSRDKIFLRGMQAFAYISKVWNVQQNFPFAFFVREPGDTEDIDHKHSFNITSDPYEVGPLRKPKGEGDPKLGRDLSTFLLETVYILAEQNKQK